MVNATSSDISPPGFMPLLCKACVHRPSNGEHATSRVMGMETMARLGGWYLDVLCGIRCEVCDLLCRLVASHNQTQLRQRVLVEVLPNKLLQSVIHIAIHSNLRHTTRLNPSHSTPYRCFLQQHQPATGFEIVVSHGLAEIQDHEQVPDHATSHTW